MQGSWFPWRSHPGFQTCECGPGHASCVHVHVCLCYGGHTMGLAGAIFRESTTPLIDIGSSWTWYFLAHCQMWPALPTPEALWKSLDACSKALGEATSNTPGPAGHIGQRARAGVWDFWLFFKALPATLSLRRTTLCAPCRFGVGG